MTSMIAMRGASRAAVAVTRERLESITGLSDTLGSELFAVVGVLDAQPTLRRTLTDPARSARARGEFVAGLLRGKVSDDAISVVTTAVSQSWAQPRDVADGLEYLGVLAEIIAAERAGALDDLDDQLFRFARVVSGDRELRDTLGNQRVPAEHRQRLAAGLLAGKATPAAVRLVEHAIAAPRGLSLVDALESFQKATADWRERLIATIRTAVPLTAGEQDRLATLLARQYGHEVRLNLIVDPGVIGGVRIDIGDDVVEGTIAGRIDSARRRMAG